MKGGNADKVRKKTGGCEDRNDSAAHSDADGVLLFPFGAVVVELWVWKGSGAGGEAGSGKACSANHQQHHSEQEAPTRPRRWDYGADITQRHNSGSAIAPHPTSRVYLEGVRRHEGVNARNTRRLTQIGFLRNPLIQNRVFSESAKPNS